MANSFAHCQLPHLLFPAFQRAPKGIPRSPRPPFDIVTQKSPLLPLSLCLYIPPCKPLPQPALDGRVGAARSARQSVIRQTSLSWDCEIFEVEEQSGDVTVVSDILPAQQLTRRVAHRAQHVRREFILPSIPLSPLWNEVTVRTAS